MQSTDFVDLFYSLGVQSQGCVLCILQSLMKSGALLSVDQEKWCARR